MRTKKSIVLLILLNASGALLCGSSFGLDIVQDFSAISDAGKRGVILYNIGIWESNLAYPATVNMTFQEADLGGPTFEEPPKMPGVQLLVDRLPDGRFLTLAYTTDFQETGAGFPSSARIVFNTRPNWYIAIQGPVPEGQYDFWSTSNHEICHAVGFAENYTRFNSKVNPKWPTTPRTFSCGGISETLGGGMTHFHDSYSPSYLMYPTLSTGFRQTIYQVHYDMLDCAFPQRLTALTNYGLLVLLASLILSGVYVTYQRRKGVVRA